MTYFIFLDHEEDAEDSSDAVSISESMDMDMEENPDASDQENSEPEEPEEEDAATQHQKQAAFADAMNKLLAKSTRRNVRSSSCGISDMIQTILRPLSLM